MSTTNTTHFFFFLIENCGNQCPKFGLQKGSDEKISSPHAEINDANPACDKKIQTHQLSLYMKSGKSLKIMLF